MSTRLGEINEERRPFGKLTLARLLLTRAAPRRSLFLPLLPPVLTPARISPRDWSSTRLSEVLPLPRSPTTATTPHKFNAQWSSTTPFSAYKRCPNFFDFKFLRKTNLAPGVHNVASYLFFVWTEIMDLITVLMRCSRFNLGLDSCTFTMALFTTSRTVLLRKQPTVATLFHVLFVEQMTADWMRPINIAEFFTPLDINKSSAILSGSAAMIPVAWNNERRWEGNREKSYPLHSKPTKVVFNKMGTSTPAKVVCLRPLWTARIKLLILCDNTADEIISKLERLANRNQQLHVHTPLMTRMICSWCESIENDANGVKIAHTAAMPWIKLSWPCEFECECTRAQQLSIWVACAIDHIHRRTVWLNTNCEAPIPSAPTYSKA